VNLTLFPKADFFEAPSFIFAVISCKVMSEFLQSANGLGDYLTFT
jgi:hypothetical protein